MIKVEITNGKAPWPAGATVGAVVALAVDILPAWAVGKCTTLADDDEREPCATWEPPEIDHSDPQARAFVVNPANGTDEALLLQLADAEQALGTARAEIKSLCAQLAAQHRELIEAQAALEVAQAATSRAEADLADAIQQRDSARSELDSLRAAVPAVVGTITGDGTGVPLPVIEDVKASTPAKSSRRAPA